MAYEGAIEKLRSPLDPARVRQREAGGGRSVPYLEGHDVITQANEVFGFDGWSYRVDDVSVMTTSVGRLFYRASVTVEALGTIRTDVGTNVVEVRRGTDEEAPEAHETAIKGAATDALKRALRSFGAQFGNELYDKSDRQPARRATQQKRGAPAADGGGGGARTVGDFLAWAWREHHLNRTDVLRILGVTGTDVDAGLDLRAAAARITEHVKAAAGD